MATWQQVQTGKEKIIFQAQGRAYLRYDNWYFPSTVYGVNSNNWSTSLNSDTAPTTWSSFYHPLFVVPRDCTFKSYAVYGNSASANNDIEFMMKKGTPNWSNSSSATALSQCGTLQQASWTRNRLNKIEVDDPQLFSALGLAIAGPISLSKGDIIVPMWRKTTFDTSSVFNYLEITINICMEIG